MIEARHIFQVMTYDIDFAGVLNNVVYVRWLEDLRNVFAEQVLPIGEAFKRGIVPALIRTEIDYLAPVRFPNPRHFSPFSVQLDTPRLPRLEQ